MPTHPTPATPTTAEAVSAPVRHARRRLGRAGALLATALGVLAASLPVPAGAIGLPGRPGTMDGTYGSGGLVKTAEPLAGSKPGVAVQADGTSVVAGDLDTTFGDNGVVRSASYYGNVARNIAVQSDGKTVAVRRYADPEVDYGGLQVERYGVDGKADASFAGGRVVTPILDTSWATDVAIQTNERGEEMIVVAGNAQSHQGSTATAFVVVARYRPDGQLDPDFGGGDGIAMVPASVGTMGEAYGVAVQPTDGKIVVSGSSWGMPATPYGVLRFGADGAVDPSFGAGGFAWAPIDLNGDAGSLAIQTIDGVDKVILGGGTYPWGSSTQVSLQRFDPAGNPESTFGGAIAGFVTDVAVQSDGSIVAVGGHAVDQTAAGALLAHYAPNGDLLATVFDPDFHGEPSVAIQASGTGDEGVIVVGRSDGADGFSSHMRVARHHADLSLDANFGNGGTVVSDFGGWETSTEVAVQQDGKIVVVGWQEQDGVEYSVIVRYFGADNTGPELCVDQTISFLEIKAKGCFTHPAEAVWQATGAVRMNGIDLQPDGTITFDAGKAIVSVVGHVDLSVGDGGDRMVLFGAAGLEWDLSGEMSLALPEDFTLRGFPVEGSATLTWSGGAVELALEVKLPELLGGVTAGAGFSADIEDGFHIDSLSVAVGEARIGALELKDLGVKYSFGDDTWTGNGTVVLPSEVEVSAEFTFTEGEFVSGEAEVSNINKFIGNGVFLQSIKFGVETDPFTLYGGAGITAGPTVNDVAAAQLDGELRYTFDDPDIFKVSGTLTVVELELASGAIEYRSTGKVDLNGDLAFEKLGMQVLGHLEGWIDGTRAFNIEGSATVGVDDWTIGANAVVSSVGMAACGTVDAWIDQVSVGVGYKWGGDAEFLEGCDLGAYVQQPLSMAFSTGYRIDEGLPVAAFAVTGASAPPAFTLVGPNGERVDAGEEGTTTDSLVVTNPATNTTYVAVARPAAGAWTIEVHKGSSPVVSVRRSDGLPKPDVAATVKVLPSRQCLACPEEALLSWSANPLEGQTVTFAEVGAETSRILGTADGASGTITFAPGTGEPGTRQIVALVEQDGLPRTNVVLGTY